MITPFIVAPPYYLFLVEREFEFSKNGSKMDEI